MIKESYDRNYKVQRRGSYISDYYGLRGDYCHELGFVSVNLTQDFENNYYLLLRFIWKGRCYRRTIKLKKECSTKYVSIQSRKFIEEITKR